MRRSSFCVQHVPHALRALFLHMLAAACATCVAGFVPACPIGVVWQGPQRAAMGRRGPCSLRMLLDVETGRRWKAFSDWATTQGIQSEKIELAEVAPGLRGVKASSPLAAGDPVVAVPTASVLRVIGGNSRLPAKLKGYVSEQTWRDAEWWGQLALLLLWEKGSGRNVGDGTEPSKMTPWIKMLPESMSTPLHWTEAEVEELQYQPLITKCIRQRTAWKVLHRQVQKDNGQIGEDEFYLACEMARSRAFSGPFVNRLPKDQLFLTGLLVAVSTQLNILDSSKAAVAAALVLLFVLGNALVVPRIFGLTHYVMAPMIDMVNHNGAPGAAAGVTYQALQATFEVLISKPYSTGEQVFISYGERSNDQLLQYYGFIERGNANDVYELDTFPRRVAEACTKLSITAVGLDEFAQTSSSAPMLLSPTGLDPSVMSAMEKMCGGEAQTRKVVCTILKDELSKFATSLESDEALLKSFGGAANSPKSLAMQLRIEKKLLLAKNIASLSR